MESVKIWVHILGFEVITNVDFFTDKKITSTVYWLFSRFIFAITIRLYLVLFAIGNI